jgi:hypothetical protein
MERASDWGSFPQFYVYIKTDEGTIRRDIFSETEALRLVSLLASMLTRQPFHDPYPDHPVLGYSMVGKPETIKSIHLYRVDSLADVQALPSVDD